MADLLASSKVKPRGLLRGDVLSGVVIDKSSKSLILDIGGKSEGLVAEKAYQESREFIRALEIGDEVTAKVIVGETPDGYAILSLRNAASDFFWKKLRDKESKDEELSVMCKNATSSGLIVDVLSFTGFIPSSHLGKKIAKDPQSLVGKSLKVKIIDLDKDANRIVLSEKFVSEAKEVEEARQAMKDVKIGEIFEGEVTTVADFGCFVKIKAGKKKTDLEGLVHVSELSWEKVDKPSDVVSQGDKVTVKVLGKDGNKLSLSMKQTEEDPWEKVAKKYKAEQKAKGKVMRVSDFGVFVQLEPGIEGLIHMTKIPPGMKLEKGKDVNVYVEEVDAEEKRIALGLILTEKPVGYK